MRSDSLLLPLAPPPSTFPPRQGGGGGGSSTTGDNAAPPPRQIRPWEAAAAATPPPVPLLVRSPPSAAVKEPLAARPSIMAWRPGGEAAFDRGVVAGRRGGRADLGADVQTTWSGLSPFLLRPPRCGPSSAARQWRVSASGGCLSTVIFFPTLYLSPLLSCAFHRLFSQEQVTKFGHSVLTWLYM